MTIRLFSFLQHSQWQRHLKWDIHIKKSQTRRTGSSLSAPWYYDPWKYKHSITCNTEEDVHYVTSIEHEQFENRWMFFINYSSNICCVTACVRSLAFICVLNQFSAVMCQTTRLSVSCCGENKHTIRVWHSLF